MLRDGGARSTLGRRENLKHLCLLGHPPSRMTTIERNELTHRLVADGEAGEQILRLQAQHVVFSHGEDQIDRVALQGVADQFGMAESEAVEADDSAARLLVEL